MVGRLPWITKISHGLGHVSIVINIWSFQLHQEPCRSPYIGASEVPNHSGLELWNKTHADIDREALTHTPITSWALLGFAALGAAGAGSGAAQAVPWPWCTLDSVPAASSAPALARLGGSCQHHCLGSLPASQMLLLENLPLCQLLKALTGCDLHPGREGGWEQEGHFIIQHSG